MGEINTTLDDVAVCHVDPYAILDYNVKKIQ